MWSLLFAGAVTIGALVTCWALVRINRETNAEARRLQEEREAQEMREEVARRRSTMVVLKGGK